MNKFFVLSFVTIGLFLFGCTSQPDISTDGLVSARLSLSGEPVVNESFNVTVTLLAESDVQGYSTSLVLPEGLELVEGSTKWSGDLAAGEEKSFSVLVTPVEAGVFEVSLAQGSSIEVNVNEFSFDANSTNSSGSGELVLGLPKTTPTPSIVVSTPIVSINPSPVPAQGVPIGGGGGLSSEELRVREEEAFQNSLDSELVLSVGDFNYYPPEGEKIDPELLGLVNFGNYSNESITVNMLYAGLYLPEKISALQALGVGPLESGEGKFLAKVPLDKVYEVSNLWFIRWVGFRRHEQKFLGYLPERLNDSNTTELHDIVVFLFDFDGIPDGSWLGDQPGYVNPGKYGKMLQDMGLNLTRYGGSTYGGYYIIHGVNESTINQLTKLVFVFQIHEEPKMISDP